MSTPSDLQKCDIGERNQTIVEIMVSMYAPHGLCINQAWHPFGVGIRPGENLIASKMQQVEVNI